MNCKEVERLLIKEHVWQYDYAINNPHKPLSEVASILECAPGHYRSYITERGKIIEDHWYKNENDACLGFLRDLAVDYSSLKKYV